VIRTDVIVGYLTARPVQNRLCTNGLLSHCMSERLELHYTTTTANIMKTDIT